MLFPTVQFMYLSPKQQITHNVTVHCGRPME